MIKKRVHSRIVSLQKKSACKLPEKGALCGREEMERTGVCCASTYKPQLTEDAGCNEPVQQDIGRQLFGEVFLSFSRIACF